MSKLLIGSFVGWVGLGGYRGYETYNWSHEKRVKEYNEMMRKGRCKLKEIEREFAVLKGVEPPSTVSEDAFKRAVEMKHELEEMPKGWNRDKLINDLKYETEYGALKKKGKPLYIYSHAAASSIGTGTLYFCLPISVFLAPKFEIMRLELWWRGLSREDLKRPDDYYFKFL